MKKNTLHYFTLFLAIIVISCQNKPDQLEQTVIDSTAIAVDTNTTTPVINTWEYSEQIDKMTSKKTKFAVIRSNESLNLEPPYDGDNYGRITLRQKGELNIYIAVDKGQISGGYDNNYIMVRFDDGKAIRFNYNEPQDYSSDLIFIDNESKFLAKLKKSKKVLLSLPFYQNGNQILEFNTSDLKWK